MSLKYNILWVDDNRDEFTDEESALREYIAELFFIPNIKFCASIDEAKDYLTTQKYDLIFSDYNIGEESGKDFITHVRNSSVNTEILFYSGQRDLPETKFDRVSYFFSSTSRLWHEMLLKKMKDLIDLSVEKLQSLESIRGLVMAEVSDLDNKMLDIIEYFFKDDSDEKRRDFDKHIVKDVEKTTKQNLAKDECLKLLNESSKKKIESTPCKHKWRDIPINEIIHKKNFESVQKAKTVQLIIEKLEFSYSPKKNNFYEDYFNDIIENRNELAHCSSFIESGIEILKTKDGERKFSKEDFTLIRSSIIKYSTIFDKLIELVK